MSRKPKKSKQISEEELTALHKRIQDRKRDLFNELISSVAAPGGLDDLEAVNTLFNAAASKEEALQRVSGTVGEMMRQIAIKRKAGQLK